MCLFTYCNALRTNWIFQLGRLKRPDERLVVKIGKNGYGAAKYKPVVHYLKLIMFVSRGETRQRMIIADSQGVRDNKRANTCIFSKNHVHYEIVRKLLAHPRKILG